MGSEEGTISKPKEWRTAEHRMGTETELLTVTGGGSKLFVLCGNGFEDSKSFRYGDFSVRMIRCTGNPVSMVTCMVGDHQWLLAKDSMALRVGDRSFVFALPGLLYGLLLPVGGSGGGFGVAEEIFGSYCAYHDLVGKQGAAADLAEPNHNPDDWAHAYSLILNLAARSSAKISTTALSDETSTAATKIQRAMRMSAAVKLVSRALLSGALSPTDHLHVSVTPGGAHAYPTMWAAANLLEAIVEHDTSTSAPAIIMRQGFWGLKEEGLVLLLDIVKAYSSAKGTEEPRKRPRIHEEMSK